MSASVNSVAQVARPLSATVIGCLWIVGGVATFLSSLEDFFKARKFAAARPESVNDPALDAALDAVGGLIGGSPLELLVFTLLSIVAVVGGVGLLKLRVWGWRTVVVGLWLMLAATFVGLPYYLWMIFEESREDPDGFNLFVIVVCIAVTMQLAFAGMMIGVMLRSLYGQRVRGAVAANETLRRPSSFLG